MTTIKTIPGIDNTKLTEVARSLIKHTDNPVETKLLKAFTIIVDGTPPKAVVLSFDELEGLINILDTTRPLKARLEPSQWTIMTYQLDDLEQLLLTGWRITKYQLELDHETKVLSFTGQINHKACIPTHPDYDPAVVDAPKLFEYNLGDFEIIQQIAISRVMASRDSKFEPVAGTFDVSWLYSSSPEGVRFSTIGGAEE